MADSARLLKLWMKREKLSQMQVGKLVGVSNMLVSEWLAGKRIPSPDHITQLALLSSGAVPEDGWTSENSPKQSHRKNMTHLNGDFMTLEEIAQVEGITRERVRQIIVIALKKLYRADPRLMRSLVIDYGFGGRKEPREPP